MRVLVTGACGFVGGYLLKHLVQSGDDVVGTFLGSPHSSHPSWSLPVERVTLDLTDQHGCIDLVNRVRPEVIYHLAGIALCRRQRRTLIGSSRSTWVPPTI